jgi:hypothetical protein
MTFVKRIAASYAAGGPYPASGRWPSLVLGLLLVVASNVAAQASTFDLSTDFSYTNNPNGAWSFVYLGSPLTNVGAPLSNGNSLIPAIGPSGYYSTGNNLYVDTPDVIKTIVDGSSSCGNEGCFTNGDFLAGDVIVHSPNDGTPVDIIWTAPSNGTISFTTDVWYAHSVVSIENRVNIDSVLLGGTTIEAADISPTSFGDRSSPWSVAENNVSISAGEELVVQIEEAAGQTFGGSLNGVEISGTFSAAGTVPEASTWAMILLGFAGLGFAGYRKARKGPTFACVALRCLRAFAERCTSGTAFCCYLHLPGGRWSRRCLPAQNDCLRRIRASGGEGYFAFATE